AATLKAEAGIAVRIIERGAEGEQKRDLLRELGAERTVAIGNGANDALMLGEAAVGIVVIGAEGAAAGAVRAADVVVTDIGDALALLSDPRRLVATLRS
ncbi:MAG: ATPase P, partial [Actinomycetota bacterium]|nr:ATPase P [Actinomycetota bacterium]